MITHLEPDVLECEVKWALESITMNKASGGDGITIELISHASKVMLKILQPRLQQYVDQKLPDVLAGFRKGRGT